MDFDLDPLDDIFADNAAKNARPGGKFRPKAKVKPSKESSLSVQTTCCTQPSTVSENESKNASGNNVHVSDSFPSRATVVPDTQTAYVEASRNDEVRLGPARESCLDCVDSVLQRCSTSSSCLAPKHSGSLDHLTLGEFTSDVAEDIRVQNIILEPHEGNTSSCLDTQDITTNFTSSPGRQIGKLQLKPKLQSRDGTQCATVPKPDDVSSVTSQIDNLEHFINREQPSTCGQEEEHDRSSKRRRKEIHVHQLVDEREEEDLETLQLTIECPIGSSVDEDDHTDTEYQLEDESQSKKVRGKSKKPVTENGKAFQKCKKSSEVPDQSTKKSFKKFKHSTRKRGRFDKDWLKIPEDDIEISDLPLKDIILLGEYRELTAKNNPETSQTQVVNQSAAKFSSRYYKDDDVFALEQGQESDDEQDKQKNVGVQDNGVYFNYQSHMKKTPNGRWTKRDTELFYEALQQFGTDLTMITQVFPSRTRNQIKLKYKKEEREHPMRLHDALTNRSKDHSHFELIIDRMKKAVAERKQYNNTTESDNLPVEEPKDVPPETKELTKLGEVEHTEDVAPAVTGPVESSGSEDDENRWSQFKSDL